MGRSGERARWPGYDYLMQAEAGYFSITGEPDSAPTRMGLSMIDYMTGALMSLGLTSAIVQALRTGAGADHPVMSNCPESRYLKVIWARVV